jgi:hypothetical protein
MKISKRATICRMTDAGVQPQRTNRRGDATRENMLEAALKALATGDPAAVRPCSRR